MIEENIYKYNKNSGEWDDITSKCQEPLNISERLDRELDSGSFIRNEYDDNDKLDASLSRYKVELTDGVTAYEPNFFVGTSKRTLVREKWHTGSDSASKRHYRHETALTEPMKLLEGILIDGFAVTQPEDILQRKSLLDVLERLLAVTPLRRIKSDGTEDGQPYEVTTKDTKVRNLLSSAVAPQFKWNSQTTLSECLFDIGSVIDAIPILEGDYKHVSYLLPNESTQTVDNIVDDYAYSVGEDIDEMQYCSKVSTIAENIVEEKDGYTETAVFPAFNQWATPRTDDIRLTDQNCKILLNKKINKINKFVVDVTGFILNVTTTSGDRNIPLDKLTTTQGGSSFLPFNIEKYVVEKSEYATLDTFRTPSYPGVLQNVYKNTAWVYEHGGYAVELVNTRNSILSNYVPANILIWRLNDYFTEYGTLYYEYEGVQYSVGDAIFGAGVLSRTLIAGDLREWKVRVEYEPLGESVKIETPKTHSVENEFAIPMSQQQQIISNQAFGKYAQALVDRLGVEKQVVCRSVGTIADIRKIGATHKDSNGDTWRLAMQNLVVRSGRTLTTEFWTKNWSYQSEYVGINREFRSWDIPANTVQRNLSYQDYCLLTTQTKSDTAVISDKAKQKVLQALDTQRRTTPAETSVMAFYNTYGIQTVELPEVGETEVFAANGALVNTSAFGFGNSLVFSAKTKDNLSAGIQRDIDDDDNYVCKDVYYCNEDGTLDELRIVGAPLYNNANNNKYPATKTIIISEEYPISNLHENEPYVELFPLFEDGGLRLKVLKDASEQLNFTYALHILTDNPNIIIGSGYAANCPLVNESAEDVVRKFWTIGSSLPQGMQIMTTDYGSQVEHSRSQSIDSTGLKNIEFKADGTTLVKMEFITTQQEQCRLTLGAKVCVTDDNNNILIANNSDSDITLNCCFVHAYEELQ